MKSFVNVSFSTSTQLNSKKSSWPLECYSKQRLHGDNPIGRLHKILEITTFSMVGSPMSLNWATMALTIAMNGDISWPSFIQNSRNQCYMMCLFSFEFSSCTMIKHIHITTEVLQLTKTLMYFSSIDEYINIMAMLSHCFHFLFIVATSKVLVFSIIPSSSFARKIMVIWNFQIWKLVPLNFFMLPMLLSPSTRTPTPFAILPNFQNN